MTPTRDRLNQHLENLENSRFYGKVTLSFEAGSITTAVIEYVTDTTNERYGLPEFYTIKVVNLSNGSEQTIRVLPPLRV